MNPTSFYGSDSDSAPSTPSYDGMPSFIRQSALVAASPNVSDTELETVEPAQLAEVTALPFYELDEVDDDNFEDADGAETPLGFIAEDIEIQNTGALEMEDSLTSSSQAIAPAEESEPAPSFAVGSTIMGNDATQKLAETLALKRQSLFDILWFWFRYIFSFTTIALFLDLWSQICSHIDASAGQNGLGAAFIPTLIKSTIFLLFIYPFLSFIGLVLCAFGLLCYFHFSDTWNQASTSVSRPEPSSTKLDNLIRTVRKLYKRIKSLIDGEERLRSRQDLLEQQSQIVVQQSEAKFAHQAFKLETLQEQLENQQRQGEKLEERVQILEEYAKRHEQCINESAHIIGNLRLCVGGLVSDNRRLQNQIETQESEMVAERQLWLEDMETLADRATETAARYRDLQCQPRLIA